MDELRRDLNASPGYDDSSPLFEPGTVVLTPAAIEALYRNHPKGFLAQAQIFVERHTAAKWPDLSADERERNLAAIENGHGIAGRFVLADGTALLAKTEPEAGIRVKTRTAIGLEGEL